MWVKTDDFDKQLKKLQRVVQPILFRYVIIQYNHADVKKEIKNFLQATFPDRTLIPIKIRETDYFQLLAKTDSIQEGFVVIEDYEYLINDEVFAKGFNQRRDRLSAKNIAYICLMPNDDNLLKKCRELIPDWWSFRSILLKFEVKFLRDSVENESFKYLEISSLGGLDFATKKDELDWLEEKISSLPETEINLRLELLQKSADIASDLELHEKLLFFCKEMECLANAINLRQTNPLNYARIQNSFAAYFGLIGYYEKALSYVNTALDLALIEGNDSIIASYQNNIAKFYSNLGSYEKAKEYLEKAKTLDEKKLGLEHPTTIDRYSNLAIVYAALGNYQKAKEILDKVIISTKKNLNFDSQKMNIFNSVLALVLKGLGDYEKAKEILEKVKLFDEKNFGLTHPKTINTYSNLALILKDLGDYNYAKELLKKAILADETNFGTDNPTTATHYANLGLVNAASKNYKEARELLQTAYKVFFNSLGENHIHTKTTKEYLEELKDSP